MPLASPLMEHAAYRHEHRSPPPGRSRGDRMRTRDLRRKGRVDEGGGGHARRGGVIPHHERDCGRPDRMLKRGIRGRRKLAVEAL